MSFSTKYSLHSAFHFSTGCGINPYKNPHCVFERDFVLYVDPCNGQSLTLENILSEANNEKESAKFKNCVKPKLGS